MSDRNAANGTLIRLADPRPSGEPAPVPSPPRGTSDRGLTDVDYVVLGYLRKFPQGLHGYRLKQVLADPLVGLRHIPLGTLYRLLQRLERGGLLHREIDPDAPRLRYRFTATARAETCFQRWLARRPEAPPPTRQPLLRRLCFADATTPDTVQRWLDDAAAACVRQLEELETHESALQGETYRRLVRARLDAERLWIEDARRIVKETGAGGAPRSRRAAGDR